MRVVLAAIFLATSLGTWAGEVNMDKYNKSCVVCHATGAANAPKTGDAAAWAPRLEKGMEALVASVSNGLNAMPPKGMCFDCTDEDYQAMIEFMAKPAE
jgi:cytochrome c5